VIEFRKGTDATRPATRPVGIDATEVRLASLLERTSRTFALSIPLIESPLREEVTIAYLLFRIADTVEDEVDWPTDRKAGMLRLFAAILSADAAPAGTPEAGATPSAEDGTGLLEAIAEAKLEHEGYASLMGDALFVLDAYAALPEAPRAAIAKHLSRTAIGMADQLDRGAAPDDVRGAQEYCYAVAGIVGELCTELFVARHGALAPVAGRLASLAPAFGEGLQLVNILRDEQTDASAGRRYIPRADCRDELLALAQTDLAAASDYVRLLESSGASPGTVAFNALNVALAIETLALVAREGPGAKLGKPRVMELFTEIRARAEGGRAIAPLLENPASPASS
jgi:farnesyl-diphosphate farnesyltransferase